MNLLGRLWKAVTDDIPEPLDLAGMEHDCEDKPGIECRWIEITVRCRAPLNDGDNMPSGCDARCPARIAIEHRARDLERENRRMYL